MIEIFLLFRRAAHDWGQPRGEPLSERLWVLGPLALIVQVQEQTVDSDILIYADVVITAA